ncbi:scavenger receptor class F member 1-like [Haliotis rubra]|uniref:scavenger receptor class F member 1-like n=1 Tax=Haliotis rubra TaxID=36100 RepID=UPI001EE58BC4|nr:scavenger receptor class F member 1-like [Haliotis rubra]
MAASVMVCLACLVIAAEADPCNHTHHCSDCDRETGHCLTECNTGYYDRRCKSTCSRNCRNNTCVLSSNGNDNCTHGCVPGYQGTSCNIPCDSPGGNCTACPGGCDRGYCQLGSSCVSGCVDSYYGTGCKNCSSGCTPCNRSTGTCDDKSGNPVRLGLYLGLSAAVALSLTINMIVCCKYCQRSRKNSLYVTVSPVNL